MRRTSVCLIEKGVFMNLLADFFIILIIILCALIGKKRGFIKTFFGFFGNVAAFILSSVFSKPVGTFLSSKVFYPFFKNYFLDSLKENLGDSALDFVALPEEAEAILSRFGTGTEEIRAYLDQISPSAEETTEVVSQWILEPIATSIGVAVAFLLLFVVLTVAIRILVKVLDLISKLPLLNVSNCFLGLLAGVLQGAFLAVLIANVLTLVEPALAGAENEFLRSFHMENTYLARYLAKLDLFWFLK